MDQVRAILNTVWRQRFWGLSAVGVLIATLCWMIASGQLAEDVKKNTQKIDGKINTMRALAGKSLLPNDSVNETDLQEAKKLRSRVREQWETLAKRQREEVLSWQKLEQHVGEEFVQHMQGRKFGDTIASDMRGNYWTYIKNRFGPMLKIVQAKKEKGKKGRTGGGGGGGTGGGGGGDRFRGGEEGGRWGEPGGGRAREQEDYLVEWLDQNTLRKKLDFPEKPSTTAIWVTQEDLWVYETLLKVIAKTNKLKGASRPDNTAIHTIVTLEVGKSAVKEGRKKGGILLPKGSAIFAGEDPGYPGDEDFDSSEFEDPSESGRFNGNREGPSDAALMASRYIDAEGAPLPGDLSSLGVEFRRLPVRMTLMMNQRWIPQVLIECANAALPVEVKQVRINPDESSSGFTGTGEGSRATGQRRGSRRNKNARGPSPDMVEVVIQGVVYIYNEPEDNSLSIPGDEDEEEQLADASDKSLQR